MKKALPPSHHFIARIGAALPFGQRYDCRRSRQRDTSLLDDYANLQKREG